MGKCERGVFEAEDCARYRLCDTRTNKKARTALECAYKALVSQLNAILVLVPSEAHDALANDINAMIAGHKTTAKAQKTAKAAAAAKE